MMADPKAFVSEYIEAIQAGATGDALARFFTDDVLQEEFPNRLMPATSGSTIVVELTWLGTLAIAIGALTPGDQMRARFCIVLELKDGRIHRQRTYDCFDAF